MDEKARQIIAEKKSTFQSIMQAILHCYAQLPYVDNDKHWTLYESNMTKAFFRAYWLAGEYRNKPEDDDKLIRTFHELQCCLHALEDVFQELNVIDVFKIKEEFDAIGKVLKTETPKRA